ncbi:hypothetical protein ACFLYR_09830, partial [Chloroflexota bacterium]
QKRDSGKMGYPTSVSPEGSGRAFTVVSFKAIALRLRFEECQYTMVLIGCNLTVPQLKVLGVWAISETR